jgi:hypothetical protein
MTAYAMRQNMADAGAFARVPALHAGSVSCWSPIAVLGNTTDKPGRPRRTEVSP